jgi:hypothetical protein
MRPVPTHRVRCLGLVNLCPMCFDIHSELLCCFVVDKMVAQFLRQGLQKQ